MQLYASDFPQGKWIQNVERESSLFWLGERRLFYTCFSLVPQVRALVLGANPGEGRSLRSQSPENHNGGSCSTSNPRGLKTANVHKKCTYTISVLRTNVAIDRGQNRCVT